MLNIGSLKLKNQFVLAPMAGITNLPFRLLVKRLGAGLVTTEMVSAMGLVRGAEKTFTYLKSHSDEKPLSVQIFGSIPEVMADAACIVVEAGADIVDINMGCPVKKIVKTGAGGALLQNPERVKAIVQAVRLVCPVPLTVKIRSGWSPDQPVACKTARLTEDCGADAVTVHPRYVSQGFSGHADWKIITKIKKQLKIPVIGNGDVFHPSSAIEMQKQTGCDGVMIGRAARSNPWIFRQILALEQGLPFSQPDLQERMELIKEHFRLLCLYMGEERASKIIRGFLLWYTKGLPHSSRFRGMFTKIKDFESLLSTLDHYFSTLTASKNHQNNQERFNTEKYSIRQE